MQSIRTYAYVHTHMHISRYAYARMRKSICVYFGTLIFKRYCMFLLHKTSKLELCSQKKVRLDLANKSVNLRTAVSRLPRLFHPCLHCPLLLHHFAIGIPRLSVQLVHLQCFDAINKPVRLKSQHYT